MRQRRSEQANPVEAMSGQIAEVVKASDRSDATPRTSSRPRNDGDGYDRIARAIFDMPSPESVHERCRSFIAPFQPSRLDYGSLADMLGEGSDVAYEARRLLANAKIARDNIERDANVILSACREEARSILEQQKKEGQRAKQITDSDVMDYVRARHPEEYQTQTDRMDRAKRMVDVLEGMIEDVVARARDLRQLVANARMVS